MADSATRQLTVLLKLAADMAEKVKVTSGLQEIEAQAVKTATAIQRVTTGSAGQKITDTSIPAAAAAQSKEELAAIAARNSALEKSFALRTAAAQAQGQEAALTVEAAAAEAVKVGHMERRLIMEIQLEAAEARLAGNPAMAVKLEREADIRLRALTIQRATNVSMEVAIAQAERLVLAQEAGAAPSLLVGANLNKAKAEAITLAREIATGSVNTRTLGAFASGLGTTFTLAGIAGFALFQWISHAADEAVRLSTEYAKQTRDLERHVREWIAIARAAGDVGDVVKVGEAASAELDRVRDKLVEMRAEQLGFWTTVWDQITKQMSAIPGHGPQPGKEARDDRIKQQEQIANEIFRSANAALDTAEKSVAVWERLNLAPLAVAIDSYKHGLDDIKAKRDAIDRNASPGDLEAWKAKNKEYEIAKKRLDDLLNTQTKLDLETKKVTESIRKVDLGELDSGQQLEAMHSRITEIQEDLRLIGVEAATPAEALEKVKTLTAESAEEVKKNREEVIRLAAAWAAVLGEITKTNDEQAKERARTHQQEVNAALREQQTMLQGVRQQQQLIAANPFLTPDAKQTLTLASMTAELLRIAAAIQQTKQMLRDSALDPAMHERLQAQLQRDQFEFDMLNLKISAINKPLGAELADWVNSFGTSAHQIAGFIEGSINQALSATNQLLIDAAFRTGDWRQTVVGLEKSLLNMFLTMLEQMALQQAASLLGITTTGTAQAAAHGAILTTAAPAAAATSVATSGWSAVIGEVLAIAAIIAIMAALGGGFKRGGFTGHGSDDEIAGPVHRGEFVFSKEATRSIGIENLAALHRSAPHFYEGGEIEPGILPGQGPGTGITIGGFHYPQGYGHHYPYVGDYGVSPHLFPGGGATPPPYGFNPGAHVYINPATGQVVTGSSGSVSAYYDPYHVNPGGSVGAFYVPSTGTYVTPGGYVAAGYHPPPTITINPGRDLHGLGMGNITAYYDPSTNTYVTPGGQVVASYDPSSGTYVTPGGEVVAGAHGGHGNSGGYPAPGYNGPGSNFAGTPIPGYTIIGHDTVNGAPIYRNVATGRLFVLPGTGRPVGPMTPQAYARATFGGVSPTGYRDTRGSAIFDSHAAGLAEMERQAFGGAANAWSPDSRFVEGSVDLTTGESIIRPFRGGYVGDAQHPATGDPHDPWGSFAAQNWSLFNANLAAWHAAPRRAGGGMIPGPPSTTDTLLAWLATGEQVIQAPAVEMYKRIFGPNFFHDLNEMRIPVPRAHFAAGGSVGRMEDGGSRMANGGRAQPAMIKVINVIDMKSAAREAMRDPAARVIIVDHVKGSAHEIGLGAVN